MRCLLTLSSILIFISCQVKSQHIQFQKITDIPTPAGFERVNPEAHSFASFLQHLKINNSRDIVLLYNKLPKVNQKAHYAILDIDVGNKDLQQCADAVIRLRAEYLWKENKINNIHFNFTSGDTALYTIFRDGFRPEIHGNNVSWKLKTAKDTSYLTFKKYLETVFMYAGTLSLDKELEKVNNPQHMQIGDLFIQTGNPIGHAIIIVDMAINHQTGEKIFMLAQSYMPAQDIHILKNPSSTSASPWYKLNPEAELITPEWTFSYNHLKRFKD